MADIEITYHGAGTGIYVSDSQEIKIPLKKRRIDRLVQKAEADQRRAKMGRWK